MTEQNYLEAVEISSDHIDYSIIWLHGLGADGRDFLSVTPELQISTRARYVFPHATIRPVGINGDMPMRAWYDINMDRSIRDIEGMRQSVEEVHKLIERERMRGTPAANIFLAGFSQGGIIAQLAALTTAHKLAGVLALSTRLHDIEAFHDALQEINKTTPWLVMHGTHDEMISLADGKLAYEQLHSLGYNTEWKQYSMGHNLCQEQLEHIDAWFTHNTSDS